MTVIKSDRGWTADETGTSNSVPVGNALASLGETMTRLQSGQAELIGRVDALSKTAKAADASQIGWRDAALGLQSKASATTDGSAIPAFLPDYNARLAHHLQEALIRAQVDCVAMEYRSREWERRCSVADEERDLAASRQQEMVAELTLAQSRLQEALASRSEPGNAPHFAVVPANDGGEPANQREVLGCAATAAGATIDLAFREAELNALRRLPLVRAAEAIARWRRAFGAMFARDPNPLFDRAYYLRHNRDVAVSGIDLFRHYLRYGVAERRQPNAMFDPVWYLERYPDVKEAGLDPLDHFWKFGGSEDRDPHPLFSTRWYLDQFPEVRQSGVNPLAHYLSMAGAAEST